MNRINQLFDHMDAWRHLPAYQLERRADIFFSIYLPEMLAMNYGVDIEAIIPEFPVRIGSIFPETNTNQSFKIDYLAKVKGENILYLIELKTDQSSRRDKQDWYLEKAKEAGSVLLLEGLELIYKATNAKKKYRYLFEELERMGLLSISGNDRIQPNPNPYDIKVIYIQPNNPGGQENTIDSVTIAEIIEEHSDEIRKRFGKSLREWAEVKAEVWST